VLVVLAAAAVGRVVQQEAQGQQIKVMPVEQHKLAVGGLAVLVEVEALAVLVELLPVTLLVAMVARVFQVPLQVLLLVEPEAVLVV
jgi:hypothetical protein